MEERVTSERYVSLVTQWGTKLSEAIKKLRQQEDLISKLKREKFVISEQLAASEATSREQFEEEKAALLVRHQEEEEKLRNDSNQQVSSLQHQLTQLKEENAELKDKLLHYQNTASNNGEEINMFRDQQLEDEEKIQKYYKKKISLLQMQLKLASAKAKSSDLELSNLKMKVGQLDKKVASLGSELIKIKKGKIDAEEELLQRMKAEMDKLDETFARLDDQNDGKIVTEQPPILEIELEAVRESSCRASSSTSEQQLIIDDYEDIVEVKSIATSMEESSVGHGSHIHEPIPSTSKSCSIYESIDSDEEEEDDDIAIICEMPERSNTVTQKDSDLGEPQPRQQPKPKTKRSRRGDVHGENTSNVGGSSFQCLCGREFSTKGRLVTHLRYHQERKFWCKICKKKFHRFSVWRKHMRVKHNENKVENFGCSNCGIAFSTKAQFHQHRREFHTSMKTVRRQSSRFKTKLKKTT